MADLPNVALSIRQPWAWAIIHAGKDIENRGWSTKYRGPVLIHASKSPDAEIDDDMIDLIINEAQRRGLCVPQAQDLGYGGIIGVAEIIDCVEASDSPWFSGRYGFVLANARPLPFMPCKGKLGFFKVDIDALGKEAA